MRKVEKFIRKNELFIMMWVVVIAMISLAPKIMKIILTAEAEAEAKYWNCHIISELKWDLYICKKRNNG